MHLTRFFKSAWLVQLLVGAALFGVSFAIENQILQAFLASPALVLALALEIGKAASIVWHRSRWRNSRLCCARKWTTWSTASFAVRVTRPSSSG